MWDLLRDSAGDKGGTILGELSPAQLRYEATRWRLINPENLTLFSLWYVGRGLGGGGDSLLDLLTLTERPGSAALFTDFATIMARLRRLKRQKEFLEKDWE